jgi:DNA-binding transcriptional MerR regulator
MTATYSTKEASELTGASRQAIRVYTTRYARYMSTEATPDAGSERRFTEADLRLMAYIYQQTKAGKAHDAVLEALVNGALETFDWEHSTTSRTVTIDAETVGTALVPIERLVATQALLQVEREERQRLLDRQLELTERLERTRQELGEALGELKAIKAQRRKPPAWWVRLFGGGE